ncbi:hypothetical protein E2C01_050590 [Portunus trituberculatus]|uniref:Uncharacterized protein n=1 Tax=Portunus trituberculatus TaxID=210409 RepID=A0A5B7GGT6_PORTR|nr:hypothetical protein [Portunus trituberculatus]
MGGKEQGDEGEERRGKIREINRKEEKENMKVKFTIFTYTSEVDNLRDRMGLTTSFSSYPNLLRHQVRVVVLECS